MPTDKLKIKVRVDGAEKADRDLGGITRSMKSMVTGAAIAASAMMALKKSIDFSITLKNFARDAEETKNKFLTVFSSIDEKATETAEVLGNSFGMASSTAMELLGDTGDMLVGFGFTEEAALELSKQVNELSVDLASFTNFEGGATRASKALTKALLGERESVKSLGISILEEDVKAQMLIQSKQGLTFESERQAKAVATLTIAQNQSGKAIGDFARTKDQLANRERILLERTKELREELGERLTPAFSAVTGAAIEATEAFSESFTAEFTKMSPEQIREMRDSFIALGKAAAGVTNALITMINFYNKYGKWINRYINPVASFSFVVGEVAKALTGSGDAAKYASEYYEGYGEYLKSVNVKTEDLVQSTIGITQAKKDLSVVIEDLTPKIFEYKEEIETVAEVYERLYANILKLQEVDDLTVPLRGEEFEETLSKMESVLKDSAGTMSNMLYEAFDGGFDNVEDMFNNMLKRMLADLIISGILSLLTGGTLGGVGMFGESGMLGGLGWFTGGGGVTNNINVNPTPVTLNIDPLVVSRAAEAGNIMRNV